MEKNRIVISQFKLKAAIIGWIGIILFSFWKLMVTVSAYEKKLLENDRLAASAEGICNFYYFIAMGFLGLGVILGLGLAALRRRDSSGF